MATTAPAVPTGRAIEALFRPTTRFRDSHRNRRPSYMTELELLPGLTVEDVLAAGVTWKDFQRFLRDNKIVWMTPDVYVCSQYLYAENYPAFLGLGDDEDITLFVHVTPGTAASAATATCGFLVRLLATCESHGVSISGRYHTLPSHLSGAGLSLLFQESQSCLRQVTLYKIALSGDQCRALATMSRLDVELKMIYCSLADDAAGAFVECLHSDRGPVKLKHCDIDFRVLASALTGTSRVTKLQPGFGHSNDAGTAVLVAALANNRGLEELDLEDNPISDDNWRILCESMKAHPTLTSLGLRDTLPRRSPIGGRTVLTDDQKAHRSRLLAETMQHNAILLSINLPEDERDEQIYTESILPYLETNRYRLLRVLAIKKQIFRSGDLYSVGRCKQSQSGMIPIFCGCSCRGMRTLCSNQIMKAMMSKSMC
jgi:hypothetical protein